MLFPFKKKRYKIKYDGKLYSQADFIKKIFQEAEKFSDKKLAQDFISTTFIQYGIGNYMTKQQEKTWAYITAIVFIACILIIAIFIPNPSSFQYTIFRIITSLAAAGFIAFVPGFLEVKINNYVRATGAIAAFVLVYFFIPK
jgi:hypothetical protein